MARNLSKICHFPSAHLSFPQGNYLPDQHELKQWIGVLLPRRNSIFGLSILVWCLLGWRHSWRPGSSSLDGQLVLGLPDGGACHIWLQLILCRKQDLGKKTHHWHGYTSALHFCYIIFLAQESSSKDWKRKLLPPCILNLAAKQNPTGFNNFGGVEFSI